MLAFESYLLPGGDVQIMTDGKTFPLNSQEGVDFARELIEDLNPKYQNLILTVESRIQKEQPALYTTMKKDSVLYTKTVSLHILSCCFGALDHIPDRDAAGRYHFEMVSCPIRHSCPYNGYNPNLKNKEMVICNPPIYLGLSKTEKKVCHLLVKTSYSLAQIADIQCVTVNCVSNNATSIYKKSGVISRNELIAQLIDQRII
ncbi:MAG: helix-turn-helix transcriptional regulator [Bacteroides graminisolvens]|nr:helix-turn-helix transcriptional regulator [Bacteroides graminisolvens]